MPITFDQENYIETTKGMVKEWIKGHITDTNIELALPEINEGLGLDKPTIFIEYNRSLNVDTKGGKRTGRGTRRKRKLLTFSIHVLTEGDNRAVMERDRIIQKLEGNAIKDVESLAGLGLFEFDMRFLGSYRLRDNVHMARCELYFEINFVN